MRFRASAAAALLFAASFDRGGGLIFDSDLNIIWLQDANYAKTSGYETGINDNQDVFAWAVHRGDIGAPVPEPSAAWLVLAGLVDLFAAHRLRR